MMKAKYMNDPNWLEKDPPNSASWSQKSIHNARKLLLARLWKRIEDGNRMNIWKDKWITGSENGRVTTGKLKFVTWRR